MEFKQIQVVWVALMGGLALYAVVAYTLLTVGGLTMGAVPVDALPWIAAAAVAAMLGGFVLRGRLVGAVGRAGGDQERLAQYFTAIVVALAVQEGMGLLLITVSLLAGAPLWALAGGGAGVLGLAIARPRREELGGRASRR